MTLNHRDSPADQKRIAVERESVVIDYSAPAALGKGAEKDEPVSAFDQMFGYYDVQA